jgi:hypothetical protein
MMEAPFEVRGGARAGWVNVSGPLAKLTVSPERLVLTAPLLGHYELSPGEVAALEPYGWLPLLGRGLRLIHTRADYPERLIFWCFGSPERLANRIHAAGFLEAASSAMIVRRAGIAVRPAALITVVAAWNALFFLDGFLPWNAPRKPGPFVLLALALAFGGASAVKHSAAVQQLVLKPGRAVGEIRGFLSLLQFVTGVMLVIMGSSFLGEGAG